MKVVTFGEIMGRLTPPGLQTIRQALPGSLNVTFAGAESNVAASLAMMGMRSELITALPENDLAESCLGSLRNLNVGTSHVVRRDGRLGLYFLETGANQRPSRVIYDRGGSSISLAEADEYDWSGALTGADWLHVTGITPSLSEAAFRATLAAVEQARSNGARVSCDLNFRGKLWRWQGSNPRELAQATMRQLLPFVDVVIANEEDCSDVLGITAAESDVAAGNLNIDRYPAVATKVAEQFPNLAQVAITLRESVSASHNRWGAMLFDVATASPFFAPASEDGKYAAYEIRNIVDRVGGGDSFAAGLIFASLTEELSSPESAIRYAVAASCLAHSIPGDCNYSSRAEIEKLMGGSGSGRVVR